jgi:hypothetical protein
MIFYPVVFVVVVPVPVFFCNNFYSSDQIESRPMKREIGFLAHPPGHLPFPVPIV